ncbi:MAG: serine/threonine protein kinase, partial [Polyangiaceae bacterium]|nr:serine/threonine protein kinase [Polyangiaceae bacterium]
MHVDNVQPPVGPGDTVAGKYQVERLIGSGGVGVVFAATHLELGEPVAIKFLLPRAAKNVVDVARFCREAQAAAQLKTEHATRVLETGVLHDGSPYMVMELLEGRDLADLLKLSGPLPIEEALEYVLQASVALAEAHRLGIVHRDIKPSNLFLTHHPDGTPLVKILDFGIAKASVEAQAGVAPQDLTKTSALLGSPLYMSPEQIRSTKSVDARSDIWSLGIVLYELLCGTTPF